MGVLHMWMGGLNTLKLGKAGSNTFVSPVRILLLSITAAALGICILVLNSSPDNGLPTLALEIALEECLGQNKTSLTPDLSRDSATRSTTRTSDSFSKEEKKEEEKRDRLLGTLVGGGGLVAGLQRDVCGMGEEELAAALRLSHGVRKEQSRYFYNGTWVRFWDLFASVRHREGVPRVVCLVAHVKGQMPCRDSPEGCVLHFHVRPQESDMLVLAQLIEREEFESLAPHAEYDTILDAGANCGIASLLFATQYPKARIVSVEPAQGTYDMLRMNTEQFPNVMAIHAGLWNRESRLVLFGSKGQAWGMQVKEVKEGEDMPKNAVATLDGISIPYLLRISGLDHFDFMKIDIEGSELQVFDKKDRENDLSFLEKVQVAVCEVHEHMRPGSNASVTSAFSSGWDQTMSGEYVVFTRRQQ